MCCWTSCSGAYLLIPRQLCCGLWLADTPIADCHGPLGGLKAPLHEVQQHTGTLVCVLFSATIGQLQRRKSYFKFAMFCPLSPAHGVSWVLQWQRQVWGGGEDPRIVITAHCGQLWHNHYWHRFNIIYCRHTCHLAHHQPQQCCFVVTLETLERYVLYVHIVHAIIFLTVCRIV